MPISKGPDEDQMCTVYQIGPHRVEHFGNLQAAYDCLCAEHGQREVVDQNALIQELPWVSRAEPNPNMLPLPPHDPHPQELDWAGPHGLASSPCAPGSFSV